MDNTFWVVTFEKRLGRFTILVPFSHAKTVSEAVSRAEDYADTKVEAGVSEHRADTDTITVRLTSHVVGG
jgi:hypothetical protein